MTGYSLALHEQHAQMLAESGVSPGRATDRGYVTVDTKKRLEQLGITKSGRNVPGLLIPQLDVRGSVWGHQYRPDNPRVNTAGKPVKYETPAGQRNGLDVPPGVAQQIGDPSIPLWVTEGVKKADAATERGVCCVALPGVWSWLGRNPDGGKVAIADWHDVALNDRRVILAFDSDVMVKPAVRAALDALAKYLAMKGARVEFCHLPNTGDGKTGLDDFLLEHDLDDLWRLVRPQPPELAVPVHDPSPVDAVTADAQRPPIVAAIPLSDCHRVFRRWLGAEYDLSALDIVLATAAVERLDGDPVWLLLVSGSGNAKTETVIALAGADALVTSTVSSEGALLSATSKSERAADATGGLLRLIGGRGLLVIKDFTSILSMGRDMRTAVLAALREVYDGRWSRNVGTDGGRTLDWTGRLVVIGATTTAYDTAHAVIAAMGDRFALVRVDSNLGRVAAGQQALRNVGSEEEMRAQLATAVGGILAGARVDHATLNEAAMSKLLYAADLVTRARTAVERDPRGELLYAHQPEMPTRFAKMLGQIVRGATSLGMSEPRALGLALRVARDSMPPQRLHALDDVASHPQARTSEVTKRLQIPRSSVDRTLQEMHLLGLLVVDETGDGKGWQYSLAPDVDMDVIRAPEMPDDPEPSPEMSVGVHTDTDSVGKPSFELKSGPTDISGDAQKQGTCPVCGEPSHEANRPFEYIHTGCAEPADTDWNAA